MENFQTLDSDLKSNTGLVLNREAIAALESARKWTKFLAILGFIFIGLMILIGFSIGSIMSMFSPMAQSQIPTAGFVIIYSIFALIYFFPILYLFQFSSYLGEALRSEDNNRLAEAFAKLNSHYKYIGILAIIFLSLYVLILAIAGIAAAFN